MTGGLKGPRALIVTYHGVEAGPPPLWVHPESLARQLDCLAQAGAQVLTVGELVTAMRCGRLPERAVAITFDDGFLSVAEAAVPLLLERGLRATIYCVADRLGSDNHWPSQPPDTPRRTLAGAAALRDLATAGFEIGAHGMEHWPLDRADPARLRREIVDSRTQLEQLLGVAVTSFAYPYGAMPAASGRALIRRTYSAACTTRPAYVRPGNDLFTLPRVDIHYLRRPAILVRAARGSAGAYIAARGAGRRARRLGTRDYLWPVGVE